VSEPRATDRRHREANLLATALESTWPDGSRQSRPWSPRKTGKRNVERSGCKRGVATTFARHDRTHQSVSSRRPFPGDRNPQRPTDASRNPRSSRPEPPNRNPQAPAARIEEVPVTQGNRFRTRRPADTTEAATIGHHGPRREPLVTRGSAAATSFGRGAEAPRRPPPTLAGAVAQRCSRASPATHEPNRSRDLRLAAARKQESNVATGLTQPDLDGPAAAIRVATDDAPDLHSSTPSGCPSRIVAIRPGRSHSHHAAHRQRRAQARQSANANAPQRVIESAHSVQRSSRSCRRCRQPDRNRNCASSQMPNHKIDWNRRPRWSEPQLGWWHADTNARAPRSEPTLQIGSTFECQTRSCGVATA
jgi:hypothetical protein